MTKPGKAAGLLMLFGYFMLFCATLMLLDAGWRAYRTRIVESQWVQVPAQIKKCSVGVYYPFVRDGGGVLYSLRCRLNYEYASRIYEYELRTVSDRSPSMRSSIGQWVKENGPGATLTVSVNPSNPSELVVASRLPSPQFRTTKEALLTALAFGPPGLLFVAIGRRLAGLPSAAARAS
jgi:hypothetical protein